MIRNLLQKMMRRWALKLSHCSLDNQDSHRRHVETETCEQLLYTKFHSLTQMFDFCTDRGFVSFRVDSVPRESTVRRLASPPKFLKAARLALGRSSP
eukprot:SAG31_NODE_2604_length_5397_cov_18.535296_4_plen_97_part_00